MIDCFDELSLKEEKHKIVYNIEIKLKDLLELPLNPWSIGGDTGPIISIKGLEHPKSFISKHRAHINIGGNSDTNKIFNYTWDEEDKLALNAEVYAVIEREMQVMNAIIDDETAANNTVPKELQDRIKKIQQQIEQMNNEK
jgi:hypothetical protein